jgi:small subunit ribosomal protein S17
MTEKAAELRSEPIEGPSTGSGPIETGSGPIETGSGPIETGSGPIEDRGRRKVREGVVISDKMDKTIVVTVEDRVKHRLYGKVLRQTSRLKAHDEQNAAALGDRVRVMETRPLSATKRWRLVEIVEKAK